MRCSGHNGCLVNFTEWSTVMSVQPFGFGTRSYVFDAVRSLFGLRNMFGGRSLSFRNMNAARRGSLPGPIIMKLCSGRVRNSFISCNAQWGNCVSGHSRTLLENPCVSFDFRPEIISCADISLLKKSAIYSFFYSSTTDVFCTGQGHLSLSSGTKLQKGGRLWVTILSAVTPELCSESWARSSLLFPSKPGRLQEFHRFNSGKPGRKESLWPAIALQEMSCVSLPTFSIWFSRTELF